MKTASMHAGSAAPSNTLDCSTESFTRLFSYCRTTEEPDRGRPPDDSQCRREWQGGGGVGKVGHQETLPSTPITQHITQNTHKTQQRTQAYRGLLLLYAQGASYTHMPADSRTWLANGDGHGL